MARTCTSFFKRSTVIATICVMVMLSSIALLPLLHEDHSFSTISPDPAIDDNRGGHVPHGGGGNDTITYNFVVGYNPFNQTSSDWPKSSKHHPSNQTTSSTRSFPENRTITSTFGEQQGGDESDSVRDIPRRRHRKSQQPMAGKTHRITLFIWNTVRDWPYLRRHRIPKPIPRPLIISNSDRNDEGATK